ncbi:MAG: thioredoxin-disulfide reductase [Chloroflexi bacterium]|jgi:thioredoxin reductase (NADPH)|nr:thioredoxin-disulfide reductase [Chloroflexota bacterium]MBT3669419.1 thioredoxin-disulfide reductase [Chloroflexota bacterium]MBT4003982.1 thioredoxin-disulfide reductase [Chloroflexota bacterium]MBT4304562.1 thioredoxin-disulfide reductase [Chloroflexota bacterium]MBT4534097.1 thioredoxin-disulfide reductase [Chloroflexota bacterium]
MEMSINPGDSQKKSEPKDVKVLIIGSGPAGLAAALYAARADLKPIVLTGMTLGGQASLTHIIENYPGFPEGLGGAELGELFKVQAERFGAEVVFDTAIEVDFSSKPYKVKTYGAEYNADTIIISTGANPRHLEIPGEEEFTGKGVSYCGTCDGFFFKDKEVVVVGGGDSAVEEGLFLTRFATKVTVVHRRDELRASPILQKRASKNPKINYIWDTVLEDIQGEDAVTNVSLKNRKTDEETSFKTDGVFIFIGHTPNTELFTDKLDLDESGYLIVNNRMETSMPGVYAAGEVADSHFRQVITSAGMGAAAAIQATRYLETLE